MGKMDKMDKMDKTTRLIKWQRITIVTMAAALTVSLWQSHLNQIGRASDWQGIEDLRSQLSALYSSHNKERADDARIIRDLDARLSKYEKRFGEIQPVRQGESVYIGKITNQNFQNFTCRLPLKR